MKCQHLIKVAFCCSGWTSKQCSNLLLWKTVTLGGEVCGSRATSCSQVAKCGGKSCSLRADTICLCASHYIPETETADLLQTRCLKQQKFRRDATFLLTGSLCSGWTLTMTHLTNISVTSCRLLISWGAKETSGKYLQSVSAEMFSEMLLYRKIRGEKVFFKSS